MKLKNVHNEVRKFTRIQKILITVLSVFVLVGTITFFSGNNTVYSAASNFFNLLKYSLIDQPINTVTDFFNQLSHFQELDQENDALRAAIAKQEMNQAQLHAIEADNKELKELMDLETFSNYTKLYASVIASDVDVWNQSVTINKGSKDGVKVDMAVITNLGLIGKVTKVHNSTSEVKLLISENKDVSVSIKVQLSEDTYTTGILQYYDYSKGVFVVQIYDANVELSEGMKIITSGSGGVFPSGILVGEINSVDNLYDSKGKMVSVTPSADFNAFSYVAVAIIE